MANSSIENLTSVAQLENLFIELRKENTRMSFEILDLKKEIEDLRKSKEEDMNASDRVLELIEWARETIKNKEKFGLDDLNAALARERRASGVLLDCRKVINQLKKQHNIE